ncbi:invasin domain 3-containing protein [Pedosphaera parvula]|uniref:Ig domain protein group 1 domain protein n=1 Tax=Pedosphaera parvula (strain Ellin514) TaxID=320771 RepID=B9XAM4_PEDPL|nr:invasin domain 3-containing protein [Pedosphaera parvula]EEF63059.1 Ig domain protein group 1 domain protein [Pedosphaera parvula Ellin514]
MKLQIKKMLGWASSALASATLLLFGASAPAAQVIQTLPFYDSFDYNQATGLAPASSTVWETCFSTANIQTALNSLTLAGFAPSAGNSVFGATAGTRFAGTQFTSQSSVEGNAVYLSFLYQETAYPASSSAVIGFLDSTNIGTSSSAPVPAQAGLALIMDHTGHIGINSGSTTATGARFESAATPLNTTVLIVVRYTFHPGSHDVVDLWVNPASASYGAATAPASDATVTNTYNLALIADFTISYRGSDSSFGEKWDEVRIGTTWPQAVPASNQPGIASAPHSLMTTASSASIVADGVSTTIVKMQARDLNGVNLTTGGATVTFATAAGMLSPTTDNGNGTYQATLTSSTTPTTAKITAKLGGTSIATIGTATNSSSLSVNFVLGPVSGTASTAVANPTTAAADGATASTITVTAMDDYGHALPGQTVSLSVSGSGNSVSTPAATDVNGRTTATLTSTEAETKTITVTIGSTQINAQPTVTFTSQGVSAFNSTAAANPNTGLVANGLSSSIIIVSAKDGSGNLLPGKTVVLAVSGSGNVLAQPDSITDTNGQLTATLTSTVAGTKIITVTVDGTVINAQPTVTFLAGPATHIAFTSQPVTTPVGLTFPAVVVQIADDFSNPVPQSGSTVTLASSAGTLSGTNPQATDSTGKAIFNDLSISQVSSALYLTANVSGFSPVQSSLFDVPPKTFYKLNNTATLNLATSWTATPGGAGPAGPPAFDGVGAWDTNSSGGTVDIGASASWYGLVYSGNGAVTVTDTSGGHTLTLGTGGLDGSSAVHSLTLNNNVALSADQTWKWTSSAFTLTLAGNLDNAGRTLTINGQSGNAGEKFNGAITGSGGLILNSNAAVTFNGTNTYTGVTKVNGGKLTINTNSSIANSAAIALASGVTFDISAVAPFTVSGGQTLAGGTNGTGTATIAAKGSAIVLAPGAQLAFTAVGNANSNSVTVAKLTVQGSVTLNGNPITVNVTGAPLPTGTYTLVTATNGFTVNGLLPMPTITGQGVAAGSVPQLAVNGQNLQLTVGLAVSPAVLTNNCGDSATFTVSPAPGGTSYQWYDPSLQPIPGATDTTLVLTNTHPSNSGTYWVVATSPVSIASNSVVLVAIDTAPPVIVLNGSNPMLIALNSTYSDPGATAYDACAGGNLAVTTSGTVNTSVEGNYTITYSAVTGAGTAGSQIRSVVVVDPPLKHLLITSTSSTPQCGSNVTFTTSVSGLPPITYQWYDNNSNAIPGATNSSYTLTAPADASVGIYTLIAQNAYNSETNTATITSVLHTAPPVMRLNGADPVDLLLNNPYVDAGATAFDLCAQASLDVSSNNPVNTAVAGTYSVTYSATTADGTPGTLTRTVIVSSVPDFGPNVLIFDPTMTNIQNQITAVYAAQKYNQFGPQRTAIMFKPGQYNNLDIPLGYYTEVIGLGQSPDDVTIFGDLYSDGVLVNENATVNFWRSAANIGVVPTNSDNTVIWAVSQGTSFRRMHVHGEVDLANHTDGNFASGGFLADSKVDTTISSIAQQQWLSRNDAFGNWSGGVWNMVFVGVSNPPAGVWPTKVYTVITNTPVIAEKPYLYCDSNGIYQVMVPALQTNSFGTTWASGPTPGSSIPISQFYVAHSDSDTAASINAALSSGLNLILTPGVYNLSASLNVTKPHTIVLGLGYPTLVPQTGTPALVISDVDGVKVGGLLFDAGPVQSTTLLKVGSGASTLNHSTDPLFLYDISMRVGGATAGSTLSCLQIDANDVVGDNLWLWRADHGAGVNWTQNACNNGLIVNGDRATMYGLFVEHQEQYQTLWNGNWGRLYFYQSELPYDPPSQSAWSHDGVNGYASYKVADQVTSHQAYGLGIYAVFIDCTNISCFNAIESPTNSQQVNFHNAITVYIAGNTSAGGTSSFDHIINGTGATLLGPGFGGTAKTGSLRLNPTFNIGAAATGSDTSVTFPSESWHSYQLQYKNALTDPAWSNVGDPIGGNDVQQTLKDSTFSTNRFYRVGSF